MTGREFGPIRTFHQRPGRISANASRHLHQFLPDRGVDIDGSPLDLPQLFGACVPVILEIGSGMGDATIEMALADPGTGILAAEVHTPGVVALLRDCQSHGVENVRVAHGDGVRLLTEMVSPNSLHGIRAFFPDPWPKARHHKRRLIRPDIVAIAAARLVPGGSFHAATDWADYADQMLAVLEAEPLLRNAYQGFAPRPPARPMTRYERIGHGKGHAIADVVFRRVG